MDFFYIKTIYIPSKKTGNITIQELASIIIVLETSFKNNPFLAIVMDEIKTFSNRIAIKNCRKEESIFCLAREQFEALQILLKQKKTLEPEN